MKKFGLITISIALIGLLISLGLDTTVSSHGDRVYNIGLMNERQNYIIISVALLLIGAVFLAVNYRNDKVARPDTTLNIDNLPTKECPFCAEKIKSHAILCRFCGRSIAPIEVPHDDKLETKNEVGKIAAQVVPNGSGELDAFHIVLQHWIVRPLSLKIMSVGATLAIISVFFGWVEFRLSGANGSYLVLSGATIPVLAQILLALCWLYPIYAIFSNQKINALFTSLSIAPLLIWMVSQIKTVGKVTSEYSIDGSEIAIGLGMKMAILAIAFIIASIFVSKNETKKTDLSPEIQKE